MLCLAHLSIVMYSIIRHSLGFNTGIGIRWNLSYFRFVVKVNIDNVAIALTIGIIAFLLTRYIRKKDGNNNDNR